MADDEPPRERRAEVDTPGDHVWRAIGWGLFFAVGYLQLFKGVQVHWMYHSACVFLAERKIALELTRKHGDAFVAWITRKTG